MKKITFEACKELVRPIGRTYWDEQKSLFSMNWTCSGVEMKFQGTCLMAHFRAGSGIEIEGMPFDERAPRRTIWPIVAVFVDGSEEPYRTIHLTKEEETHLIFESLTEETHTIRIVKLTENYKTRAGITYFVMDGEVLANIEEKKPQIEFIGDSITCGFGNMTTDRDRFFYSEDENGFMSHAAIAARMLGLEVQMLCVSGICSSQRVGLPQDYGMNDLYPYTDRIYHDKEKKGGQASEWDFAGHPSEYVVLNLGTNDATAIMMSPNQDEETENFRKDYLEFVKTIRRLNGADTWIVCALGSMDYYLYHDVVEIVEAYKKESRDTRISTFRYKKMAATDPMGACAHPHLVTQQKMAKEIVEEIKRIEAMK